MIYDAPAPGLVDEGAGAGEDVAHPEDEAKDRIVTKRGEAVDVSA